LEIESDDSRKRALAVGFVTGFGMDYFLVGVVWDLIRFFKILIDSFGLCCQGCKRNPM
jgi:hypothetical protein